MLPRVKVCGFPLVIFAEVPCSLFRTPLRLSNFVLSKVAGKLKLTKRPADTEVPATVGCSVRLRARELYIVQTREGQVVVIDGGNGVRIYR